MSLSESDRGAVFFKHFLRPFQALSIVIGLAPIQCKTNCFYGFDKGLLSTDLAKL